MPSRTEYVGLWVCHAGWSETQLARHAPAVSLTPTYSQQQKLQRRHLHTLYRTITFSVLVTVSVHLCSYEQSMCSSRPRRAAHTVGSGAVGDPADRPVAGRRQWVLGIQPCPTGPTIDDAMVLIHGDVSPQSHSQSERSQRCRAMQLNLGE